MNQKKNQNELTNERKQCYFCIKSIDEIDYKDVDLLKRFVSSYAKIISRRRRGTCAKHQRKLTKAIKRARFMALLPYVRK